MPPDPGHVEDVKLELSPNNKRSGGASDRYVGDAGTTVPDTKIVPLRGRADTAVARNPRTQRRVHVMIKEKEGTAVPVTAAPYNSNRNHIG